MQLKNLGYTEKLAQYRADQNLENFDIGRIISEHKDRYGIKTQAGELNGELIGQLRFNAENRYDFPAVGDWVAVSEYDDGKALIHAIFPRHSILERKAVGGAEKKQIIATNIDYGLIVQSINRDFSINRLERYLTICHDAGVEPIIILSKIDLIKETEVAVLLKQIKERISNSTIFPVSNHSLSGFEKIKTSIQANKTYCLLGSSGVGKSTLLNNLLGKQQMPTGEISQSIDRGKHVTTHRELIVLDDGGIIIDNPGMRELGISDSGAGIDITFDAITEYSQKCKFRNCSHVNEKGCAILDAIEEGQIEPEAYDNYLKLQREKEHYESKVFEKRKKDKEFGRMVKGIMKNRKTNKF